MEMAKKDDDALFEITIETPENEEVPPQDFVKEIYDIAKKRHQRSDSGIYPSDFLYDMIPTPLMNGKIVWWMAQTHPIALMLLENNASSDGLYNELSSMSSAMGHVIIYSDEMVKECRDCLVGLCKKFDLKVLEEEKSIEIKIES